MVKRKMKKAIKQKQKQNVNVKQNVKVVVGEIKKKRAVKSSGAKSGAGAKPPIVLNISNPQPQNNILMEYFKKQLQNQQPVKANTLAQQEKINEREETKASKVGALHSLDQDPGKDQERELRRQRIEGIERFQKAQAQQRNEAQEVRSSLKPVKKEDPRVAQNPLRPRLPSQREILMGSIRESVPQTPPAMDSEMLSQLRQQQSDLENAINITVSEGEPDFPQGGAGAVVPAKKRGAPLKSPEAKYETAKRRAEKKAEEKRQRDEIKAEAKRLNDEAKAEVKRQTQETKMMTKNDPYEKSIAKATRQANKILKARAEAMGIKS